MPLGTLGTRIHLAVDAGPKLRNENINPFGSVPKRLHPLLAMLTFKRSNLNSQYQLVCNNQEVGLDALS